MAITGDPATRRPVSRASVTLVRDGASRRGRDEVVGEEPLEVRVVGPDGAPAGTTSTMRTAGHDVELAVGLLHAEGVIAGAQDVAGATYCTGPDVQAYNVLRVGLRRPPRRALVERTLPGTASCGVCGTASVGDLLGRVAPVVDDVVVDAEVLCALPDRLRGAQAVFARTGGAHASGLFAADGALLEVREDVGRHNALDKLLGARLLAERLPLHGQVVLLSGRVSFELVQKAAAAGVPILAAVGAPSALAVETARALGMTLVAFVRDGRCTVYAGAARVRVGVVA